eukprot:1827458-Pleurochrysis_carterae.AAC.1
MFVMMPVLMLRLGTFFHCSRCSRPKDSSGVDAAQSAARSAECVGQCVAALKNAARDLQACGSVEQLEDWCVLENISTRIVRVCQPGSC